MDSTTDSALRIDENEDFSIQSSAQEELSNISFSDFHVEEVEEKNLDEDGIIKPNLISIEYTESSDSNISASEATENKNSFARNIPKTGDRRLGLLLRICGKSALLLAFLLMRKKKSN